MSKTTYTVQRNGQVTLPPALREEYGLKEGDQVSFLKNPNGWMIVKQNPDPIALLDQLGDVLKMKGITFEQLVEDGEEIRSQLVEEIYGLTASNNA